MIGIMKLAGLSAALAAAFVLATEPTAPVGEGALRPTMMTEDVVQPASLERPSSTDRSRAATSS